MLNPLSIDRVATCHPLQVHAKNNRDHAQNVIEHHIHGKGPKSPVAKIAHALISKRRKSGEGSAKSGGGEQPKVIIDGPRLPSQNIPNDKAARYIHDKGPIREAAMVGKLR